MRAAARRSRSDRVAKQRRHRHVVRAAERPQREGERGRAGRRASDSASSTGCSAGAIGSGRIVAEQADDRERQRRAEREADERADRPRAAAPASDRSRTRSRPVAPSALNVAITSRLRSRWLFTALATPTPPTSSAARPTSVRNWVKRSTLRSSCGEALLRVRISQPACGSAARASSATAWRRASSAVLRQPQAIVPAHQTARLQQAVARSASSLIRKRGPKPTPPEACRARAEHAADLEQLPGRS